MRRGPVSRGAPVSRHLHQLSVEECFVLLHSGRDGLEAREAVRRLHEFGPNQLATAPTLIVSRDVV